MGVAVIVGDAESVPVRADLGHEIGEKHMSITKKFIAGLGGAALLAGITLVGAAPAQAAIGDCPSGSFCFTADADFTGDAFGSPNNVSSVPANRDDRATSVYNHGTQCNIRFYQLSGYGGRYYPMAIGAAVGNLATKAYPDGGTWNDRLSGFKFCP